MASGVLLEGGGLGVLREVLAVFPEQAATTPEDVILNTLRNLLQGWRTLQEGEEEVQKVRLRVCLCEGGVCRGDGGGGEEGNDMEVMRLGE